VQRAWLAPQVRQARLVRWSGVRANLALKCLAMPLHLCGVCPSHLSPLRLCRALNPARVAAATLLRYQQTAAAEGRAEDTATEETHGSSPAETELQVLAVEHFSREPQDW